MVEDPPKKKSNSMLKRDENNIQTRLTSCKHKNKMATLQPAMA
jgi:hypothetical protein